MAYLQVIERLLDIAEGTIPDVKATVRFHRIKGKGTAESQAVNSGSMRALQLVTGPSRRGPTVNGNAPKQVIHEMNLISMYPTDSLAAVNDMIEADYNRLRAEFEDTNNYLFESTGLQNVQVLPSGRTLREGSVNLNMRLIVTYIGSN